MNTKILITGTRAPSALELARLFSAAGSKVYAVDSLKQTLCSASNCIEKSFTVPPPKQQPDEYINSINAIVRSEKIDVLIPTCEEIYTLAKYRSRINCDVFCDSMDCLVELHNKFRFIQKVEALGLAAPKTWKVQTQAEAVQFKGNYVLKPCFTRFATEIHYLFHPLPSIDISPIKPWIVQEYLNGPAFCTYSIARRGVLRAHVTYPVKQRIGNGACIYFEAVEHLGIQEWVTRFIKRTGFHGQIAFDFIEGSDGIAYPIECNPRATSGVHLFSSELLKAFLTDGDLLLPHDQKRMVTLAMLTHGFPNSFTMMRNWFSALSQAHDVIWNFRDPLPFFAQFAVVYSLWKRAKQTQQTVLKVSTEDIEWNGEI